MSSISSVSCGFPLFQDKQTGPSVGLRSTAVVLGLIAILIGSLALANVPGISDLSLPGGLSCLAAGGVSIVLGIFIRCLSPLQENDLEMGELGHLEAQVEVVPFKKSAEIVQEAESWMVLAYAKYEQIHQGKPPKHQTPEAAAEDAGRLFNDSLRINYAIHHQISNPPGQRIKGGETWDTILVCRDNNHKIQAIALYEKTTQKLGYLATHPNNLRHPLNEGIPARSQGAGTQIMLSIMRLALINNLPIRLKSLNSAVPFYTKLAFTNDPEQACEAQSGLTAMKLTAEKIREKVSAGIPPFDQIDA